MVTVEISHERRRHRSPPSEKSISMPKKKKTANMIDSFTENKHFTKNLSSTDENENGWFGFSSIFPSSPASSRVDLLIPSVAGTKAISEFFFEKSKWFFHFII